MNKRIVEATLVNLYKRLLNLFGAYCDLYPATSVDGLFEIMVEKGTKTLSSDKRALDILDNLICGEGKTTASIVHSILNTRFSDLPAELKPVTKSGRRDEVAFWIKDGNVLDKVKDLLNFADEKGKGFWGDAKGEKVTLLDTEMKEVHKKDKTKKVDIEQPALKTEPKPDKGAEDLATKVNMEPVDFKKPVKKETKVLLKDGTEESIGRERYSVKKNPTKGWDVIDNEKDETIETWTKEDNARGNAKSMNEDGNIAYRTPGRYRVFYMDQTYVDLDAMSQYDAKKKGEAAGKGKKVLHAKMLSQTQKTYQATMPVESTFHSVIVPEHSIDPTGQRFEVEASDLASAEKKIKEQFGEATKIMQLEPVVRNRLGTGNIFDIMRDVKEDFEEEHGLGKGRDRSKDVYWCPKCKESFQVPEEIRKDRGVECPECGFRDEMWEKKLTKGQGEGNKREEGGAPHIGGREGPSPGLQKVANAVNDLTQKHGKLTPELLLKYSKDIPVLSKKIRGELSRAENVLYWYKQAVRRQKENKKFRCEQNKRTTPTEESLCLCNSCAKTFRNTVVECVYCKGKDVEKIEGGNKVDEKKVKKLLAEEEYCDGCGFPMVVKEYEKSDGLCKDCLKKQEEERKRSNESKLTEETKVEQQLKMGIEVEKEHTDDPEEAAKIAVDHLKEDPDYYTKLKKMEAGQCENKVKEAFEDDKSKRKIIARGFEKKEDADAIARTKQGQVVADDAEPEKFMIISKLEESSDWDYSFKYGHDRLLSNPLITPEGETMELEPLFRNRSFKGAKIKVFTEHQEQFVKSNGGVPVREKVV